MKIIKVGLKDNPYNIYIGYNSIKEIPLYIKKNNLGNFGIILTSKKIYSLYKSLIEKVFKGIPYKVICVADGEKAKSKKWLLETIEEIIKIDHWNKRLFIVCLGGGTVGDLGGFAAAIYKRGTPYIQIPTTLLSQIDASIGGKTGIDLKEAKNIIGTIYQPNAVFIDPLFLQTLPKSKIKEGMAEVIKYGIIKDKVFFDFLKSDWEKIMALNPEHILKIISICAGIKANIIKEDEKEKKGIRTILNFGHTFAHAVEASLKYKRVSHGEAVSLGMLFAANLSFVLGQCRKEDLQEVKNIIRIFSLREKIALDSATICKAMSYDKKFISGEIRMVILKKIGEVKVVEGISLKTIEKSFKIFTSVD